jgi:hypothetical protein
MSAGITLAQANAQLTSWLAADTKVATGQSYSISGRSLTRANAKEIRDNITFWDNHVKHLTRGGIRVRGATPC